MKHTHYLSWFTTAFAGKQVAACGTLIDPKWHSTEPSCPACQRYLNAEPEPVAVVRVEIPL